MYKLLLSWRYLRTRFIALASIVSVTLGVATLIVVNSVMSGFVVEMKSRLHGILSDIEFDAGLGELAWPQTHVANIEYLCGDDVEAIAQIVRVPALLNFEFRGNPITQQIMLIGVDEATFGRVCEILPFLSNANKRQQLSFFLEEQGYDERLGDCGWTYRREKEENRRQIEILMGQRHASPQPNRDSVTTMPLPATSSNTFGPQPQSTALAVADATTAGNVGAEESTTNGQTAKINFVPLPDSVPQLDQLQKYQVEGSDDSSGTQAIVQSVTAFDPEAGLRPQPTADQIFDARRHQHTGIILGIAIGSRVIIDPETGKTEEKFLLVPGDDVRVTLPTAGQNPTPIAENCTVVDFYSSNMHEYDSSFAFMPLRKLQKLRGMIDPITGDTTVSAIQIRLKPEADLAAVRDKLRRELQPESWGYVIQTWQDLQRPLLSAVNMELTILNILLFLIIAVAGFGILATFFMIVVEKTKDIGVLKSLGAPSSGVMSIFLGYGLSLGAVGTGVGIALGLAFVAYINEIADLIGVITGQEIFDPTIYYFSKIPTIVEPWMVVGVAFGAVLIAVSASVLPAIRAARLRPVEALRYE